eukprot:3272422-Prymnesium_polylepis.1
MRPAGASGHGLGACDVCPFGSLSTAISSPRCWDCARPAHIAPNVAYAHPNMDLCSAAGPSGTYSGVAALVSWGGCQLCPAGTYAPAEGATRCLACNVSSPRAACPVGSYALASQAKQPDDPSGGATGAGGGSPHAHLSNRLSEL